MADNGTHLTPAQRRAVAALLANRDNRSAAIAAHIGERTLARWLTLPHFRAALASAEDALMSASARRLLALQTKATDRLESVIDDPLLPAAVRLRAAQLAIDATWRALELSRLSARVAELEARLEGTHGQS